MTRKDICIKCVTSARDLAMSRHRVTAEELREGYDRCLKMADGAKCVFLSNRISIDTVIQKDNKTLFIGDGCQYRLELLLAQE